MTSVISLAALVFFYLQGNLNMMNFDAFARLNIARKIIDNLTPGIGQIGGIWLPLPHVLLLPVIWMDFLWHSGLAGAIISAPAFVLGAIYLEKTAYLLTKSHLASFVVWLSFVANQNVLLFQTSAMSESFFLCSVIMTLYFLTRWITSQNIQHLLIASVWIILGTLTRYEGYFILVGSVLTLFTVMVWIYRNKNKALIEGTLVLFSTISGFGILLWMSYSAIFFKDPLYWMHFYDKPKSSHLVSASSLAVGKDTLLDSFLTYSQASIWTNGIIFSILAIAGFLILLFMTLKNILIKKDGVLIHLALFIIGTFTFAMLVFGYQKGMIPLITFHDINLVTIFNKSLNRFYDWGGPNIRYGLIMTPFLSLFAAYAVGKSRIMFGISCLLIILQLYTNFYTPLYLQFSIAKASKYIDLGPAVWMRANYDHGLIFISSQRNEDLIFQTNLPYKNFIHEGTRNYWKNSLDNPARYSRWVILNDNPIEEDKLPKILSDKAFNIIDKSFQLVYEDQKGYKIYKRI